MLKERPAALEFIKLYVSYANLVDDIIDEGKFQNAQTFLRHTNFAETLHSHPYWIANIQWLRPVLLITHNDYADSVEFDSFTGDTEKKQMADVLRIAAFHVVMAVVYNELGHEAMREISSSFRFALWKRHKDEAH